MLSKKEDPSRLGLERQSQGGRIERAWRNNRNVPTARRVWRACQSREESDKTRSNVVGDFLPSDTTTIQLHVDLPIYTHILPLFMCHPTLSFIMETKYIFLYIYSVWCVWENDSVTTASNPSQRIDTFVGVISHIFVVSKQPNSSIVWDVVWVDNLYGPFTRRVNLRIVTHYSPLYTVEHQEKDAQSCHRQ